MSPSHPIIDLDVPDAPFADFEPIESALMELADRVGRGECGASEQWRGADVIVVDEFIAPDPNAFYPDDDQLITEHVAEVSWGFFELRDVFAPVLDSGNKYWFFGTLRRAAQVGIDAQLPAGTENPALTLGFMVAAATTMLAALKMEAARPIR